MELTTIHLPPKSATDTSSSGSTDTNPSAFTTTTSSTPTFPLSLPLASSPIVGAITNTGANPPGMGEWRTISTPTAIGGSDLVSTPYVPSTTAAALTLTNMNSSSSRGGN